MLVTKQIRVVDPSYYDLASIAIIFGINVESITVLQGIKVGKVSEVTRCLTILVTRSMEVILHIVLPIDYQAKYTGCMGGYI